MFGDKGKNISSILSHFKSHLVGLFWFFNFPLDTAGHFSCTNVHQMCVFDVISGSGKVKAPLYGVCCSAVRIWMHQFTFTFMQSAQSGRLPTKFKIF